MTKHQQEKTVICSKCGSYDVQLIEWSVIHYYCECGNHWIGLTEKSLIVGINATS